MPGRWYDPTGSSPRFPRGGRAEAAPGGTQGMGSRPARRQMRLRLIRIHGAGKKERAPARAPSVVGGLAQFERVGLASAGGRGLGPVERYFAEPVTEYRHRPRLGPVRLECRRERSFKRFPRLAGLLLRGLIGLVLLNRTCRQRVGVNVNPFAEIFFFLLCHDIVSYVAITINRLIDCTHCRTCRRQCPMLILHGGMRQTHGSRRRLHNGKRALRAHTPARGRTHAYARPCAYAPAHAHAHAPTRTRAYVRTHVHAHTCAYARTCAPAPACARLPARARLGPLLPPPARSCALLPAYVRLCALCPGAWVR